MKLNIPLLAILLCILSGCSRSIPCIPTKVPVFLNDSLSNADSDIESLEGLDKDITSFLDSWDICGASLAIMRNDSLVYVKSYGLADKESGSPMEPRTLLRVASVSKLITATGIMLLAERGELKLSDKVFGPDGLLKDFDRFIYDRRCRDITVEHLLRHSSGLSSRAGDPMFSTRLMMKRYNLAKAPDHETLAKCTLRQPLAFSPGQGSEYSNFGYLLLSMIIETISGEDYEHWTMDNVLIPSGCIDMHISGNFHNQRRKNESRYYAHSNAGKVPCFNGSGAMVERCYGGSDITSLSGAGAWISSAAELCRFVASIDGRKEVADILSEESIKEMTSCTDSVTYGIGWTDCDENGEWTRTGTLAGTSALIKFYPDGECWIMVTNTGTWRGPRFSAYIAGLFKKSREKYSSLLPHRDLFYY